jgi:hypothetical protein
MKSVWHELAWFLSQDGAVGQINLGAKTTPCTDQEMSRPPHETDRGKSGEEILQKDLAQIRRDMEPAGHWKWLHQVLPHVRRRLRGWSRTGRSPRVPRAPVSPTARLRPATPECVYKSLPHVHGHPRLTPSDKPITPVNSMPPARAAQASAAVASSPGHPLAQPGSPEASLHPPKACSLARLNSATPGRPRHRPCLTACQPEHEDRLLRASTAQSEPRNSFAMAPPSSPSVVAKLYCTRPQDWSSPTTYTRLRPWTSLLRLLPADHRRPWVRLINPKLHDPTPDTVPRQVSHNFSSYSKNCSGEGRRERGLRTLETLGPFCTISDPGE